ncbi:MobV family relaxase [Exiguobacterium artemiae]|uniref:MobV family relaxase n=2 Tax=Bacillati TaxID=1783272 RepID=UPI003CFC2AF8
MGSKLVCRMQKVKKNDVKGYQIHNQRERESKTNPDINASLSHLNRDYINAQHISYMEKWKETFESQNESKRALRKDAVYFNEFVVGSDRDFFKDMDQSEKERFFKVSTDFFKERYGEQNVLYSVAHFDELKGAGAHAHIAIVPMREGKLQSKNVFDRNELKALQSELPQYLQKHGFDIERGKEGSKAQHIDTATYKVLKSQEAVLMAEQQRETIQGETKLLEAKREDLKELFEKVERIDSLEYEEQKTIFGKETGNIVIDREDFEQMKDLAMMKVPDMEFKNEELQREITVLQSKIEQKDDKISNLQKKYEIASAQAERYKSGLDEVVEDRVSELLEEKVTELKEHHAVQLTREIINANHYLEEAEQMERKLGIITRNANVLESEKRGLEKENDELQATNEELTKENKGLYEQIQKANEMMKAWKERFDQAVEKRVSDMLNVVRASVHRATREWLIEKLPDNQKIGLDHMTDHARISKRANEMLPEIVEERDAMIKKRERDRGMDLER